MPKKSPREFKELELEDLTEIEKSDLKDIIRMNIYSAIKKNFPQKSKIHGFTLPATQYVLERDLIRHYGKRVSFACVEKNKNIFTKSLITARSIEEQDGIKIFLFNSSDLNFFQKTSDTFDFMWLDYCGPWSKTKKESLRVIFDRNLLNFNKGRSPIIGLTLMNGMDFQGKQDFIQVISDKDHVSEDSLFKLRISGIPKVINNLANEHNKSVHPISIIKYHDKVRSSKAVSMLVFLFKVYNGKLPMNIYNTQVMDMTATYLANY